MPTSSSGARSALVLYGSETGNAQDAAEELGRLLRRLHFAVVVDVLDAASLDDLRRFDVVVVAISTTGQGELPHNARAFWKRLLRKKLPPTLLADARFGVYGLGDTSYPQFNYAALKLSKRLAQLGALELLPVGAADEQHPEGDATLIPWASRLQSELLDIYPLPDGSKIIAESVLLEPQWLLSTTQAPPRPGSNPLALQGKPSGCLRIDVKVEKTERVTPRDHWQDVRHLTFSSQTKLEYAPGDVLEIQPRNPAEEVEQLLALMNWSEMADAELVLAANPRHESAPLTKKPALHPYRETETMTLSRILTESIDINGIPKRSFFRMIAHFTSDEFQQERLKEFANPEFTDELFDYTTRPRRSILEVLQEFDTVKIPWQWIYEIFRPLRPRQFSIASGGELKADETGFARFELLVAIVKYRTVIRKLRRGTCTRYLEDLEAGSELNVGLVPGSLGIRKAHASTPLVLVGPGTGIAPLRALLWEKQLWKSMEAREGATTNGTANHAGNSLLFFGCRNESSDYFFRDEWSRLRDNIPLDVRVACSRDQQNKVYVQDLLLQEKQRVFDMLYHQQGILCVCGSSGKMPAAVRASLIDIFEQCLGCSQSEAEALLRAMEKAERYKQETW